MADQKAVTNLLAKLNEVADLVSALRGGNLGAVLKGSPVAGCDYHCGCNDSYCRCNGSVKSQGMDAVSFPEFLKIREERLAELRREMQALDIPPNMMGRKDHSSGGR